MLCTSPLCTPLRIPGRVVTQSLLTTITAIEEGRKLRECNFGVRFPSANDCRTEFIEIIEESL